MRQPFGSTGASSNAPFLDAGFDRSLFDGWITRMFDSPVTVLSSRLTEPLQWPGGSAWTGFFDGADDFDLELLQARTFDSHTQVLTYRPTRHS